MTLLLRPPPASMADGIVTHIADARGTFDYQKAQQQHAAYAEVFRQHGWDDIVVPKDDALPDSVFVEDGVVSVQSLESAAREHEQGILILASPGADARKGEIAGIEATLQGMSSKSKRRVARIELPGTLDGGDVLKVPSKGIIYVGESLRTNEQGRRQFAEIVSPLGWTVKAIPVKKALHLKSMLTALPDGTVIGYAPYVEDTEAFDDFVAMPEAEGVAVVLLDPAGRKDSALIISSSAPQSASILRGRGYNVITTDVSEFEKLEGCVTCLSVRIRS